jgi:Na+/H+ antiporter NhaA
LRARRRLALPLVVGLGGMAVPIGIYLAFNAGRATAGGWGTAMSTDTAFALGMLALIGAGVPDRVRTYLLTFSIVDDVAGIIVIGLAYSSRLSVVPLAVGLAILAGTVIARRLRVRIGAVYLALGIAAWVAFFKSGVDPVVVGLVVAVAGSGVPGRAQRPGAGV